MALPNPFIEDQNVRRNFEELDARLAKFETSKGGLWGQSIFGAASVAITAQFDMYLTRIVVPVPAVLTGVRYQVGSAINGTVYSRLYSPDGTVLLRDDTTGLLQSGALGIDDLPFASTIEVGGGAYFVGIQFGGTTTATFLGGTALQGASRVTDADTTAPTTITPVTAARANHPLMTLY